MSVQDKKPGSPRNLSIEQLASEYGGSESFWRREIWGKRLRIVRLGARVFVPRVEVERYMSARTLLHDEKAEVGR
jgi:hypothetical protein